MPKKNLIFIAAQLMLVIGASVGIVFTAILPAVLKTRARSQAYYYVVNNSSGPVWYDTRIVIINQSSLEALKCTAQIPINYAGKPIIKLGQSTPQNLPVNLTSNVGTVVIAKGATSIEELKNLGDPNALTLVIKATVNNGSPFSIEINGCEPRVGGLVDKVDVFHGESTTLLDKTNGPMATPWYTSPISSVVIVLLVIIAVLSGWAFFSRIFNLLKRDYETGIGAGDAPRVIKELLARIEEYDGSRDSLTKEDFKPSSNDINNQRNIKKASQEKKNKRKGNKKQTKNKRRGGNK